MRLSQRRLLAVCTCLLAILPACPSAVMAMSGHEGPMDASSIETVSPPCHPAQLDGQVLECCLFHARDAAGERSKIVPARWMALGGQPQTISPPAASDAPARGARSPDLVKDFFQRSSIQRE